MSSNYTGAVAKLLTYSTLGWKDRPVEKWPDYLALGFGEEHVDELLTLASDEDIQEGNEDDPMVWAPVHAWRTLGQLRAAKTAPALLALCEPRYDDDWFHEEMLDVLPMMGPAVLPAIATYLDSAAVENRAKITATCTIEKIGNQHPESREDCVAILVAFLDRFADNDPDANAFAVLGLVELKSAESIDVITKAFKADMVDIQVMGDLEDVEIELGLRSERETPRPEMPMAKMMREIRKRRELEEQLALESQVKTLFDPSPVTHIDRFRDVGRNDPCPCGSGRKFKKCCLN